MLQARRAPVKQAGSGFPPFAAAPTETGKISHLNVLLIQIQNHKHFLLVLVKQNCQRESSVSH